MCKTVGGRAKEPQTGKFVVQKSHNGLLPQTMKFVVQKSSMRKSPATNYEVCGTKEQHA